MRNVPLKNSSACYILFFALIFCACRKEQASVLEVDFEYVIADSNYTVPARILLYNKTTGSALFYKWTFSNANLSEYNQREPGEIIVTSPGTVRIKLEAWNDEERKEKIIDILMDSVTIANFVGVPKINDIVPAEFDFRFTGQGASQFLWNFEGANTNTSFDRNPSGILFSTPGLHKVFLFAKNERGKSDTITKWVSIRPALSADFNIVPTFDDDDYEAPLTAVLHNNTISATQHQWSAPGGILNNSTDSIPTVTFNNPGTYTITYIADNGKQSATISKTIIVKPNSGLRTFTNVELGINTAHQVIGSFFSTRLRKVIPKDSVTTQNGHLIDICFFGLSSSFSFNKFISPDSVHHYTFLSIPNATNTVVVNRQETCGCSGLTPVDFDAISNGTGFNTVSVVNSFNGGSDFNSSIVPRVILFKNTAGKIGAIKIKQFVSNGGSSYIKCDIKVQKD